MRASAGKLVYWSPNFSAAPRKRVAMSKASEVRQDFLDSAQYRTESILLYENVYGEDFVSPGGRDMARELIARMRLAPGSRAW